ncbi:MAG: proline--tRNA ligase, partial [Clostridia bacterium]|nr:proline--tRNA ligase [Clostridia bacterium]
YDRSLQNTNNLVCGANKMEYHCTGLDMDRDIGEVEYHDFAKIMEGGICPICGKPVITVSRGIEVGNIFQLGTKYTKSMGMTYVDQNGKSEYPIMGCYGIGVGRLAAAVCEVHHDEYGPIWPKAIAPWHVHLCAMRVDDPEVRAYADQLYADLLAAGVEVIYDDRTVSAGVMFSDADLLGVPLRVVVSPRNLKQAVLEVSSRDKSLSEKISMENAVETIQKLLAELK